MVFSGFRFAITFLVILYIFVPEQVCRPVCAEFQQFVRENGKRVDRAEDAFSVIKRVTQRKRRKALDELQQSVSFQ